MVVRDPRYDPVQQAVERLLYPLIEEGLVSVQLDTLYRLCRARLRAAGVPAPGARVLEAIERTLAAMTADGMAAYCSESALWSSLPPGGSPTDSATPAPRPAPCCGCSPLPEGEGAEGGPSITADQVRKWLAEHGPVLMPATYSSGRLRFAGGWGDERGAVWSDDGTLRWILSDPSSAEDCGGVARSWGEAVHVLSAQATAMGVHPAPLGGAFLAEGEDPRLDLPRVVVCGSCGPVAVDPDGPLPEACPKCGGGGAHDLGDATHCVMCGWRGVEADLVGEGGFCPDCASFNGPTQTPQGAEQ